MHPHETKDCNTTALPEGVTIINGQRTTLLKRIPRTTFLRALLDGFLTALLLAAFASLLADPELRKALVLLAFTCPIFTVLTKDIGPWEGLCPMCSQQQRVSFTTRSFYCSNCREAVDVEHGRYCAPGRRPI